MVLINAILETTIAILYKSPRSLSTESLVLYLIHKAKSDFRQITANYTYLHILSG